MVAHHPFGTAKVKLPGLAVDIATARYETYPHPGALPAVYPGTILEDLARRDFTINAMALRLCPGDDWPLLDPLHGEKDLRQGLVRALHDKSFQDDATRIWRAVRYEQRLGFHLEDGTENALRRDLAYLDTISPDRLRHEVERTLDESQPERAFARAKELGVLAASFPPLCWSPAKGQAVADQTSSGRKAGPLLLLALLAADLTPPQAEGFISRLALPSRWATAVRHTVALRERLGELDDVTLRSSQVYATVARFDEAAIQTVSLLLPPGPAKDHLDRFLSVDRYAKPRLRGDDLLALGVPQGPLLGSLMEELKQKCLDGELTGREAEKEYVLRRLTEAKG